MRKFHSILHKSMDLVLYGWSENMSTQSGESAHKVNCSVIITNRYYTLLHIVTHYFTLRFDVSVLSHSFRRTLKMFRDVPTTRKSCCVWSDSTCDDRLLRGWSEALFAKMDIKHNLKTKSLPSTEKFHFQIRHVIWE